MGLTRRSLLGAAVPSSLLAVAGAAGLLRPGPVHAASSLSRMLADLRSSNPPLSDGLMLQAPDIAEDGASVFITCDCRLPEVDALVFFVDRNPQPLVAAFHLAPEVEPHIQFRLKVAESANVWVMARSQGRFVKTAKAVKVTRGGCGLGIN
ncbi:MAG: thiosulfate oxidation carrier protein SoxY [Pseudomonadota bacterium]